MNTDPTPDLCDQQSAFTPEQMQTLVSLCRLLDARVIDMLEFYDISTRYFRHLFPDHNPERDPKPRQPDDVMPWGTEGGQ